MSTRRPLPRPSSRTLPRPARLLALAGSTVLVSGAVLAGCGGSDTADSSSPAPSHVNVTLGAKNASLVRTKAGTTQLVLTGYQPTVEVTALSPGHERIEVPTAVWARGWKAQYEGYEPNSVLAWEDGATRERLSFAIAAGAYNPVKQQMTFDIRPLAAGARNAQPVGNVAVGSSGRTDLGDATLFIDPTTDFGANTATQDQAATQAVVTMLSGQTVSSQSISTGASDAQVVNGLATGEAYTNLTLSAPSSSAGPNTVAFTGAPAFATSNFSNATWQFSSPDGNGVTFSVTSTGSGSLSLATGTTINLNGMPNLVVFSGNYRNGTLTGTLGSNSTLIGGAFSNTTFSDFTTSNALLANINLTGASFTASNANGETAFNDSALLGVDFSGATLGDRMAFNGTSLVPYVAPPGPSGGDPVTTNTSFEEVSGTLFQFGPTPAVYNEGGEIPPGTTVPLSTIDGVNFSNSTWDGGFGLAYATVTGADFSGMQVNGGVAATSFTNSTFDSATTFTGADLGIAKITGCTFTGTDFSSTTFENPSIEGTTLSGVTFSNESFSNGKAQFTSTTFDGVVIGNLSINNEEDVALVSSILTGEGNTTQGDGLQAFGNVYVLGLDGTWYQQTATSEWTPINTSTLQANGDPVDQDPTTNQDPAPAPDGGGGDDPSGGGSDPSGGGDDPSGEGDGP